LLSDVAFPTTSSLPLWPASVRLAIAYDVASALVDHGVLPELTYRLAVQTFGQNGATELIYLVGLYCLVGITTRRMTSGELLK
jgi:hypothetical protein